MPRNSKAEAERLFTRLCWRYPRIWATQDEILNIRVTMNNIIMRLHGNGVPLNQMVEKTGMSKKTIELRIKELSL